MSRFWSELRFRRDHRWTPPHMSAYLDSDLLASAQARVERHTAECSDCRGVLADLRKMLSLLQSAPPPYPVADAVAITGAVVRRLHEPASP